MARGHSFAMFLALSLLVNALCIPSSATYRKRRGTSDNQVNSQDTVPDDAAKQDQTKDPSATGDFQAVTSSEDNDDDDFDNDNTQPSSGGGGSNLFSLLNVASALLPSLSGNNNVKKDTEFVKNVIQEVVNRYQTRVKRQDIGDNEIDIEYVSELKPPFHLPLESAENDSESPESESEDSEEDNGAEESAEDSAEQTSNGGSKGSNSKQDSASAASNGNNGDSEASDADNDSDYDEPEGDGQGGGILGLLAGLSGDGESDLGSLLAAVGGIVASLSGDGVDINAIIATGLGLFVGLLSDEGSNPGEIIASYLLTSLDTITGGGAQNNGAFFGKFLSTLVKGTSAVGGESDSASDENGGGMKMADSAGFFASLLMGLLGEMSKHSSSSSWR